MGMLYFLLVLCTRLGYDTNKCVGVRPSIQPGRVSAAPGESRVYDRRMDGHQTDGRWRVVDDCQCHENILTPK